MEGIITLTSDFGSADIYVAAMKGVTLGINPQAKSRDAFCLPSGVGLRPQGGEMPFLSISLTLILPV